MAIKNIELVLITLKFSSILIGSFFGAYGLIIDFKDKNGNITIAGKRALIIIICSAFVSISAQSLELIIEKNTALKEIKTNNQILNDIDRSLNPIKELKISCGLQLPFKHKSLISFYSRFNNTFNPLLNIIKKIPNNTLLEKYNLIFPDKDEFDDFDDIFFQRNSQFLPDKSKEELAFNLFFHNEIEILINKKPIPIELIRNKMIFELGGDLSMKYNLGIKPVDRFDNYENNFFFSFHEENFRLMAEDISSDSRTLTNNGEILSIHDLQGCQILISLSNYKNIDDELINNMFLIGFVLKISKGREFWIEQEDLIKVNTVNKVPTYIFQFPNSYSEFDKYLNIIN